MRAFLPALGAVLLAVASPPAQEPPRLVVLVCVDQLASWVLEPAWPHFGEDGFRRLRREGVEFARCAFRHACTETGPGHATFATGAAARTHGIIGNTWADAAAGKSVYCVAQEDAELLGTAGPRGGSGRGPALLRAPTLGETMRAHLGPEVRIASVAWKDRSAILMAGRTADAVLWVDTTSGELITSRAYAEALPSWAADFNRRSPAKQWFGAEWARIGPDVAYAGLVDDRPFEGRNPLGTRVLPHAITGGEKEPGSRFFQHLYLSPFGNELLLAAALAAIDGVQLGQDEVPDLLCIGFSSNDAIGHQYGPRSVEVRDATLRTDRLLAELFHALDARIGADRYVVVLSADHGIAPIPEAVVEAGTGMPRMRAVQTVVQAVAAAEQALRMALGAPPEKGWIRRSGAEFWIDRAAFGDRPQAEITEARRLAAAAMARVPGVRTAVAADDLLSAVPGDDPVLRSLWFAAHPARVPDIALVLEPHANPSTTPAMHGMPYPYDQEVPLFVRGAGVRAGTRCDVQVGPGLGVVIAARLLGIPKPALADEEVPPHVLR